MRTRGGWVGRAVGVLLLCLWVSLSAQAVSRTALVDPFIGTDGTGHVVPGATVPFGMVFPSPDNADHGWAYSGGYQYRNPTILGFSNTHHSGAGIPELGDVLLQPREGWQWTTATTDFSAAKSRESAHPGYYQVRLAPHGVTVELTATRTVALQRYRFDHAGHVQVLVDLQHGLHYIDGPTVLSAVTTPLSDGVAGTLMRHNWVDRQVSFIVRFDRPVLARRVLPAREGEKAPRVIFDFDLGRSRELVARIALSTVDEAGARQNLAAADGLSFDAVRRTADAQWNRLLNRICIEGDRRTQTLFYSALYRTLQHPSDIADVDGRVRGPTGLVMNAPGGVYYSTLSLWDTFRASHPLYTLIVPERVPGMINTLIAHQQQMGFLPIWTSWGRETYCMIGNPSLPVIADALAKGFDDKGAISREAALAAMLATSAEDRPAAPEWTQRGWSVLNRFGYLPFDLQTGESVSLTAEFGIGDAALAAVARRMGRADVAERFTHRAAGWRQLWDSTTHTLRGRDSTGRWRDPFDPVSATSPLRHPGDYTEANAWQYTATPALHDPSGFREQLGGSAALEQWLDRFFSLPIPDPDPLLGQEALIGQYAHGNEPSHHVTWLYAYTDAPDKGQRLRAAIVRQFYSTRPDGIVGNDDVGQMSAWLVFAMLGFYPAEPFSGQYVTGSPMVASADIDVGAARRLHIEGHGMHPLLNGRAVPITALRHADIAKGGDLRFQR